MLLLLQQRTISMRKPTVLLSFSWLTTIATKKSMQTAALAFHSPQHHIPSMRGGSFRLFSSHSPHNDPDYFLHQVESTVDNVLNSLSRKDIHDIAPDQRESLGVARHLQKRLQALRTNNDCPRCWMQQAHCICPRIPSVACPPSLNRVFLILHHKEVAMKVDTSKLILAAFPRQCRLVVAGIGPDYQESMKELLETVNNNKDCLVLFPDDHAKTMTEIVIQKQEACEERKSFDLIVVDGTWAQARKIHARYIPSPVQRVQLSQQAVDFLGEEESGHQLRRHSTAWRQVGTFEATRLFLKDLEDLLPSSSTEVWKKIEKYQEVANEAAKRELPPPRQKR
jgi:DTW domain-containing protein YfiP